MNPFDQAWAFLKMPHEARALASQIHEGQKYGDEDYMTHVDDVASQFEDPHLQRIAYLHDTVEDGNVGLDDIHGKFGNEVGDAIDAITRRSDEQYFDYIERVKEHPEAKQVKIADLESNLRNNPNESLAGRYNKALNMLKMAPIISRIASAAARGPMRQTKLYNFQPFQEMGNKIHGPVKYYHGTSDNYKGKIMNEGLKPRMGHPSAKTWTTLDPATANSYADAKSQSIYPTSHPLGVKRNPQVFGVREGAGEPTIPLNARQRTLTSPHGGPTQVLPPTARARTYRTFKEGVPPEHLVDMGSSAIASSTPPPSPQSMAMKTTPPQYVPPPEFKGSSSSSSTQGQ